jgi:hypothetical protein
MLGVGVYCARWDKACDFARHDVDNVARVDGGAVLRVALCLPHPSALRVLGPEDVCDCGCARAFVDHTGARGVGFSGVAVPDNAGSATRRVEVCVKDADLLVVLGHHQP